MPSSGRTWNDSRETAASDAGERFRSPLRLEVVDSTNRYLADLARAGAPEGTSVLAAHQTAGRGRLGRTWVDAGDAVLCSVLFRPVLPPERWSLYSWLVALAARDACADAAGVELRCKWPNDLESHPGGKKVAGSLAEAVQPVPDDQPAPYTQPGLVVGIGINCTWPQRWPPPGDAEAAGFAARATSLDRLAGLPVDAAAVADRLLDRIAQRHAALASSDGAARALAAEYRRNLATIGQLVRVDLDGGSFTGRAVGVDEWGRLLVEDGACVRTVAVGDVVHLRPALPGERGAGAVTTT